MAKQVSIDKLDWALTKILSDYGDEVRRKTLPAISQIGKAGAAALREKSKETFKEWTGNYASGWTCTTERRCYGATAIIYNKKAPGLPHLLEYGHANVNGGYTSGRPHIKPVVDSIEENVAKWLVEVTK